ncbi:hypothetical protein GN956_G25236 [Arapaima gigas]
MVIQAASVSGRRAAAPSHRYGRLTFHIVFPVTFLQYQFVETAILFTYHTKICDNCSVSDALNQSHTTSRGKLGGNYTVKKTGAGSQGAH